ncbi:hypothetical protein C6A85_80985, partial [Mycobacterium sp. ITM-2017-0098]
SVVQSLVPSAAIDQAEAEGMIVIDTEARVVRLAHPLYGEARRGRIGTLERVRLCRRVSDAIGALSPSTPQQVVQRAVLIAADDRPEDAELLTAAANSALHLMDLKLAVNLAERATRCDGGVDAQILYGFALLTAARAEEGERVLVAIDNLVGPSAERAQIGLFRAASLSWVLGRPSEAEAV